MSDFYLRAESEQALYAALESAGIVTREDDGVWVAPGYALDVIGPISRRIGGTDEEPIMQAIPGFHANLRGELSAEQIDLLPVIDAPQAPVRVWF
jgi:hypothetical protein